MPYLSQLVLNSSVVCAGGRLAGRRLGRPAGVLAAQHGIVDGGEQHGWSHVLGEKLQGVQLRQHAPWGVEEQNYIQHASHRNCSIEGDDQTPAQRVRDKSYIYIAK